MPLNVSAISLIELELSLIELVISSSIYELAIIANCTVLAIDLSLHVYKLAFSLNEQAIYALNI